MPKETKVHKLYGSLNYNYNTRHKQRIKSIKDSLIYRYLRFYFILKEHSSEFPFFCINLTVEPDSTALDSGLLMHCGDWLKIRKWVTAMTLLDRLPVNHRVYVILFICSLLIQQVISTVCLHMTHVIW